LETAYASLVLGPVGTEQAAPSLGWHSEALSYVGKERGFCTSRYSPTLPVHGARASHANLQRCASREHLRVQILRDGRNTNRPLVSFEKCVGCSSGFAEGVALGTQRLLSCFVNYVPAFFLFSVKGETHCIKDSSRWSLPIIKRRISMVRRRDVLVGQSTPAGPASPY